MKKNVLLFGFFLHWSLSYFSQKLKTMELFLNGTELSLNSPYSVKHELGSVILPLTCVLLVLW